MLRVAEWKNRIIRYALKKEYDHLFLTDSDLVLKPELLEHLLETGKDVISEIFWTRRQPGQPLEPNVWLFDEYDMARRNPGEEISAETANERKEEFFKQLKVPGVYEVGGLGACTLISRKALLKGVDFSYIPNLTIRGEDRFFCIRAAVLGIGLYVDTACPARHIYRSSDLTAASCTTDEKNITPSPGQSGNSKKPRIVLSMTVRNEEGRYLERVLGGIGRYIDEAVIIDDASTDRTVQICEELLRGVPHRLIRNKTSLFSNEVQLRRKQWQETLKAEPGWILSLDADEVPEREFWNHLREMAEDTRYDSGFRIQHFGWSRLQDRKQKYDRYRRLDPESVYGIRRQYESILDSYPHLLP